MRLLGLTLAATCAFYTVSASAANDKAKKHRQASISYSFEVIGDIGGARVVDINHKGELAAQRFDRIPDSNFSVATGVLIEKHDRLTAFQCPAADPIFRETAVSAINNRGSIVGFCGDGTAFVKHKGGSIEQFLFPGAHHNTAFGINDFGHIVGEYVDQPRPVSAFLRLHSFILRGGEYRTIAIERVDPSVPIRTWARSINNRGQITGIFHTVDPVTNETGQHRSFIYDNGQFTFLDVPDSIRTDAWDINNYGQIVLESDLGFFLYDDGRYFQIEAPTGYLWSSIPGINDKGQLVGVIREDRMPTSRDDFLKSFQVIATPER